MMIESVNNNMNNDKTLTTNQAFWHCLSLVLGLGTLTIPYTLKGLGWSGVLLLAILAYLSSHTAKLLCYCVDYNTAHGKISYLNSYPDIGEAAFGKYGRAFVTFVLYLDLVASSALFLVFIATNLHTLFPDIMDRTQWIVFISFTLLPTVWLKLQKLSWLSTLGSYLMLALVVTVVYATFSATPESFELNEYHFAKFEPSALGNLVFAFACHGTLITIYREMSKPSDVGRLFDRVYFTGFLVKCVVGITGYYLFAQNTKDQITLNLPIPWLRTAITLALTLKNWLTYALPLEPVAVDCEKLSFIRGDDINNRFGNLIRILIFRSILVAMTTILALWLPYFGLFQSLIGSLCAGFLVLVFPEAFYIKLYGRSMSKAKWWMHIFLLVLFTILVILAVYGTIQEAIELSKTLEEEELI